jgi:hypothetical protein
LLAVGGNQMARRRRQRDQRLDVSPLSREKRGRAWRPRTSATLLRCGSRLDRFPDTDLTSLRH